MASGLSVVVLSWDGRYVLTQSLPAVIRACEQSGVSTEIIVVDNGSTDGTDQWLAQAYPQVKVIKFEANQGSEAAANAGFAECHNSILVSLSNDMCPRADCFKYLTEHFNDPDLFMVKIHVQPLRLADQPLDQVDRMPWSRGFLSRGLIEHHSKDTYRPEENAKVGRAFYASGGVCAMDRKKFMDLGGFDPMYLSGYSDDIDLSYRALKRGWTIVSEPRSMAHHDSGTTMYKKYSSFYLEMLAVKNRHVLFWKNISDWRFWAVHVVWWPLRFAGYLLRGRLAPVLGMLWAFQCGPAIAIARRLEKPHVRVHDKEIFEFFHHPLRGGTL